MLVFLTSNNPSPIKCFPSEVLHYIDKIHLYIDIIKDRYIYIFHTFNGLLLEIHRPVDKKDYCNI